MSSPYPEFIQSMADLVERMRTAYPVTTAPAPRPKLAAKAPVCLIFSPHPDDECIIGGWPLRLMRECGYRVVNIAVTQGSNKDRQAARFVELEGACNFLGFELRATIPGGLEGVNPKARNTKPDQWADNVACIATILAEYRPACIFVPHNRDWNQTHIGTHLVVMDALATLPADFRTTVVETEYWGAMDDPNMVVEIGTTELADLLTALSYHVGEISRNPYHIRVAPWMIDNVRRGAEVVGGQGGESPDFTFATLYRIREWRGADGLGTVPLCSSFLPGDAPANTVLP